MPIWRRRNPDPDPEPVRPYRTEYMTVQDVANHAGTSGYVCLDEPHRGGLHGMIVGGPARSQIGVNSEGQAWITRHGAVTVTPLDTPWAYVAHVAGEGMTVFLPDQWGNFVTLLADNPPDRWIPAAPGKDPGDVKPRGISAPHDSEK
ncbi:hypothetical protein [Streptomyces pseudovenezuelae]|uniref:hypothetical protein n=1 Tax=Streptomyces pseudovenezuelae TaxID=67350 RepID=UPI002E81F030|nr:hypothetical protein [Streptomyces pseudovenezuelae]WUA94423.1 hypothetical protein OHO81_45100 [Streptomyces pseudovenezuelae]